MLLEDFSPHGLILINLPFENKINRFFHKLIRKAGGSSTSDRNVMSFHEWSAAEGVNRHKQIISRVEDPAMFHINTNKYIFLP
jgi:hypothetical protein